VNDLPAVEAEQLLAGNEQDLIDGQELAIAIVLEFGQDTIWRFARIINDNSRFGLEARDNFVKLVFEAITEKPWPRNYQEHHKGVFVHSSGREAQNPSCIRNHPPHIRGWRN
jgi:hypothetical protein